MLFKYRSRWRKIDLVKVRRQLKCCCFRQSRRSTQRHRGQRRRHQLYVVATNCRTICMQQYYSTQLNGRRREHLFVRISMTLIYIYVSDITFTDLSPVPVRSAVKSYFTSWSIQNLSKRALNRLTELTSTTWLGKLFQISTIRAEK